MRKSFGGVIVGAFILACSPPASAQNAQIMGTVNDATGAVIPGATVTARNESTGVTRAEVTDGVGSYRLLAVSAGFSRELMRSVGLTADFAYVNRYAETSNVDIDLPDRVTRLRTYPQFGRVTVLQSVSKTRYRALLLKLDKHLSQRWSDLVSYRLAFARDLPIANSRGDAYGYIQGDGNSVADRRHVMRVSGTVQLPWDSQFSAIFDLRTSQPFNPATSLVINGETYTGDLPVGVGFRSGCRDLNLDTSNTRRAVSNLAAVPSSDVGCVSRLAEPRPALREDHLGEDPSARAAGAAFQRDESREFRDRSLQSLSVTFGQVNHL